MLKKLAVLSGLFILLFLAAWFSVLKPWLEKQAALKARAVLKGVAAFDSLSFSEGALLVKSFSAGSMVRAGSVSLKPVYSKLVSPGGRKPFILQLANVSVAGTPLGNGSGEAELNGDTVAFSLLMTKNGLKVSGFTVGRKKNSLKGRGTLVCDSLRSGRVLATGLKAGFTIEGRKVAITSVNFGVFGGTAKGTGSLVFNPGNIAYAMDMEYGGLDLNRMPGSAGIRFNGRFNGAMRISGTARTLDEMIERLTGMKELSQ